MKERTKGGREGERGKGKEGERGKKKRGGGNPNKNYLLH